MKKLLILTFTFVLFSCTDNIKKPEEKKVPSPVASNANNPSTPSTAPSPQLPNPASVNCEKQGGKLSIVDTKDGQQGICTFDDKSQCEEWAFYRGECKKGEKIPAPLASSPNVLAPSTNPNNKLANPASINCEQQGGKLSIIDTKDGQQGMCTFDDKSQCEEWAFYKGECKKGDSLKK
ncbi:MAG: DUF333 domain-containing protein [Candidatus Sericytochromatia bacterium]